MQLGNVDLNKLRRIGDKFLGLQKEFVGQFDDFRARPTRGKVTRPALFFE